MGYRDEGRVEQAKKRKKRQERCQRRSMKKEAVELEQRLETEKQLRETLEGAEILLNFSASCALTTNSQEEEPMIISEKDVGKLNMKTSDLFTFQSSTFIFAD